jgi:hypothetical protein
VKRWAVGVGGAAALAAALSVPVPAPDIEPPTAPTPFRWDADELFGRLEAEFERAASLPASDVAARADALESEGDALLATVASSARVPHDELERLATVQFELAVAAAASPPLMPRLSDFLVRSRVRVMRAAAAWPLERPVHEALYRVVFGGRIALDEALVQAGLDALPALRRIEEVPSATPSVEVDGVRVHSGDILLSRGGAPTSALIARGNDFPNTFSHVALAHVDAETGEGVVLESLIETGSVLTSVEEYLESKKHRILVLRLPPEHPAMAGDPLLPHRAAERMLELLRSEHLPYDFAMESTDPSAVFCSEIVYHPYREVGVELWQLRSPMSAPGLVSWLAAMGVREFTSLVPSDVEYDPQLRAVMEWRDAPALMEYRLDNAITDALLEEAERGGRLGHAWYALAPARLLKAYSVSASLVGGAPTIPRGMSASTALLVNALVGTVHPTVRDDLVRRATQFRTAEGYEAPYWALVELAREALAAERAGLSPALRSG